MKKLLRNKRMFLTLIAGMLVFMAVLGAGTFAWYTDRATVTIQEELLTATVKMEADDMTVNLYSWHPSTQFNTQNYQLRLEATCTETAPGVYATDHDQFVDDLFDLYTVAHPAAIAPHTGDYWAWDLGAGSLFAKGGVATAPISYLTGFTSGVYAYVLDKSDDTPMPEDMLGVPVGLPIWAGLIKKALVTGIYGTTLDNVTPGDLIVGSYAFRVNKGNAVPSTLSTIPVYFRLQEPNLYAKDSTGVAVPLVYETFPRVIITGHILDKDAFIAATQPFIPFTTPNPPPVVFEADLRAGADGWFYCDTPLSPYYAWEVKVQYNVYVYGEANGNASQGAIIGFGTQAGNTLEVEIIQATNNAVYMADGWKVMAAQASTVHEWDDGWGNMTPVPHFFVDYTSDEYGMYQFYKDNGLYQLHN
jgi:predicted ribosomally synthesized peptide with SipW-like signal peptide